MKDVSVARRYARALFELANEEKVLDDVLQGLSNIRTALNTEPRLWPLLRNPMVTPTEKVNLLGAVTSNKLVLKFIELISDRKRIDILETVHDVMLEMSDAAKGVHRALVRSAVPLSDEQKRAVESSIAKSSGGAVVGQFEVDPDLLGGVWVQMGDKVLDASVRGRIDAFRSALGHSAN
jgi:F-type H+-transporting ATPase subunit delta